MGLDRRSPEAESFGCGFPFIGEITSVELGSKMETEQGPMIILHATVSCRTCKERGRLQEQPVSILVPFSVSFEVYSWGELSMQMKRPVIMAINDAVCAGCPDAPSTDC